MIHSIGGRTMSDLWKQCEGQIVDNQFPLLKFLANTNHSAVFLTELKHPAPRKAALKFISADVPAPDRQLAIWKRAEKLSHPHLLQIFQHGRTRIAGMDVLFVIMEYADENLGQFLPTRPLNAQETRDVLEPLVDTLGYLHGQGLTHSHLKPSNLLAIADQLKLSSDTILPIGEVREAYRDQDIYDAPENSAVSTIEASPSADVWSLGITLVEALTQQAPPLLYDASAGPAIPDTLPQPFLEIARHSLIRDPQHRWMIAGIAAHLNPELLAAAAIAASSTSTVTSAVPSAVPAASTTSKSVSVPVPVHTTAPVAPIDVPLSTEPAVPLKKLPSPQIPATRRYTQSVPERTVSLPSYLIPIFLGAVLVVGAIFTLPKIFRSLPNTSVSTASTAVPASPKENPALPAAKSLPTPPPSKPVEQYSNKPSVEPKRAAEPIRPPGSTPTPAVRTATSSSAALKAKTTVGSPNRGEVLDQVLPQASAKALSTIHGTVRVLVRVQVDPVGNVASAEFDSPGPSKYFSDLALRAAQRWQFASPVSEGHSLPSQWLIRFEFSPTGVTAVPAEMLP
jgi:TonB family protein